MAEDQKNPNPADEEEKGPDAENQDQKQDQAAPEGADNAAPDTPEQPAATDEEPEILGEQPEVTPEQLAPETGTDGADAPVVDEQDPAQPEALSTDPLIQDDGQDGATAEEEALLNPDALGADDSPLGQTNVFEEGPEADEVDGLEAPGVGPGDPLPDDPQEGKKPDGVSDHNVNEGADKPGGPDEETAKLFENFRSQQDVDDEWREMNAREHLQKVLRSRDGRTELDDKYLNDVKGLKYYPETDSLKINIGFGKNIVDSPEGVRLGSGFFTQESAEMVMAVTRTHEWAHQRPVKLFGSKSAKNKLWLAAMRQGVKVDPGFQPSKKYLQKWNDEKHEYQQDNTADDLYPGTGPADELAQQTPAGGDSGPEQQVAEKSGEELETGAPAQEAAEQEAAELDAAEAGGDESPIPAGEGQDVNEIAQDTSEPVMDTETANASPEEIEEYKASVDARISAAIDELSGNEDQVENVQKLRATQESLQGGQFDVQTLERVDSALLNQKFDVALNAVNPDGLGGDPVKSADLSDAAPVAPRNDSAGKMKI